MAVKICLLFILHICTGEQFHSDLHFDLAVSIGLFGTAGSQRHGYHPQNHPPGIHLRAIWSMPVGVYFLQPRPAGRANMDGVPVGRKSRLDYP